MWAKMAGITLTAIPDHHPDENTQKEISHVVDYRRNSRDPVAARLLRAEHKSKLPANWRLDSYSDRRRCDPHHIAPSWCDVIARVSFN
jgi:hypothetical protein